MWPFISPINLIRYLFAWRVNSSLVCLPKYLPIELSAVLGTIIANRLPTREARPWRKALAEVPSGERKSLQKMLKASWPIEAVLFMYPGKLTYGQGELILWELKLLGKSADHGLFLETILPAMEEASATVMPQWKRPNSVWGHFDIDSVYVARGRRWEPVVQNGQLDLDYYATPTQWAEGLNFEPDPERIFDSLTWVTPFNLSSKKRRRKKIPPSEVPTLRRVLEALIWRVSQLLPGKHTTPEDVWAMLDEEEKARLQEVLEQAALIPLRQHKLDPTPRGWPPGWLGTQAFPSIPHSLIPYLEVAAILHIGQWTHFGCGTFVIT